MRRFATLSVLLISLVSLSLSLLGQPPVEAGESASRSAQRRTPKEEALIALGRRLFFDPLVSRSGRRSCASCHDPDHGFSDPARISEDDLGLTRRHSQTLLDSHLNPSAHWDGEFENVEELVLARIGAIKGRKGKLGHGVSLRDIIAQQLSKSDGSEVADENQEDEVIDDGDERTDRDDDNSYSSPERGASSASPRGPADAAGGAAAPVSPGSKSPAAGAARPEAGAGLAEGKKPTQCRDCGQPQKPDPRPQVPGENGTQGGSEGSSNNNPTAPESGGGGAGDSGPYDRDEPDDETKGGPKDKADDAPKADDAAQQPKDAKQAKKNKGAAKKKKEDDEATLAEIKRRADELRRALRKLPLAQDLLQDAGRYDEAFAAAFGNNKVNTARIARAIAAYCRTLESTTSAFDRFAAGEATALSASAKRGLALFRGRAACATCHSIKGDHPTFTDFEFHNTGVVWNSLSDKQRSQLAGHDQTFRRRHDNLEVATGADEGRARRSTRKSDLRSFKTPTLRDVAKRGPFMHDGRFQTLTAVVAYYARGASPDPAKATHVKAFDASKQDIADLVAFMESLSGDERPGLPAKAWRERAPKTRLRLVDADGKPLVNVPVQLSTVGDLAHTNAGYAKLPGTRLTDDRGWIEFSNRRTTHTRITLPGGLAPLQGSLVPDSCRKAKLVVPVRGRAEVVVRFPAGARPPAVLAAEHLGTFVLPGHDIPRTRLTRGLVLDLGGSTLVRYSGWVRTDVPATVRVLVPGLEAARSKVVLRVKTPARLDLTSK